MDVPTVRQCLPQRCACRSTSCGTTQTELIKRPRKSNLSFKRLMSSPTPRKGDWNYGAHIISSDPNGVSSVMMVTSLNCCLCEFRPMENSHPSSVFFKVKKTHEVSTPSQNGELAHQKGERKQHSHKQPSQQIHHSQPVQPESQSQSTSSDAGGSESEGGSLPPSFPDEDPERMRHSKITAKLLQQASESHYMLLL